MKPYTYRYFIIPYLLFLIIGILQVTSNEHGDAVIWMNNNHNDLLNVFFRVWTYGGDVIAFIIIAIFLLIRYRKYGYIFLVIGAVQGIIQWSMKQYFFAGTPRPKKYFEDQQVLDLVHGVSLKELHSFPSGHTVTAFASAAFLALMIGRREWSFPLLVGAVLVGISRIYLNHHFLVDVVVGSIVGVVVATTCYKLCENYLRGEVR